MHFSPSLYIDTPEKLEQLCRELRSSPWLAIDTEFLRESTYYPQFCLLQIANEKINACVDPLNLQNLQPLWQLIYQPETIKVFHAGRQDLEIFYHLNGTLPTPVFDTQLAAPLLGYSEQMGYAHLVAEVLGVHLEKGHSRTDWRQRPLSPQQIEYAINDVRYLVPLYLKIHKHLALQGRLTWLEEDFRTLTDPATYTNLPEEAWRRVKGVHKLRGRQLAILKQLAGWREQRAMEENLPRGWILKEDLMCQIARLQPKNQRELAQLRGISDKTLKRHGANICRLINTLPLDSNVPIPKRPPARSVEQEALLDLLNAVVRLQAATHGLNPLVLASRKDLERFLDAPEQSRLCQGWRHQLIGEALLALVNGTSQLRIVNGQLQLEEIPS